MMKTKHFVWISIVISSLLFGGSVLAQDADLTDQSPVNIRKNADASVDRNILIPTAETVGQGDFTFNSYELFLAGFTYGITDDLQISMSTLLPIVKDMPFLGTLATKLRLVSGDRFIFSIQPSFTFATQNDVNVGALGLSFMVDFVLDNDGDFVLSLAEGNLWAFGGTDDHMEVADGMLFNLSVGLNYRVHNIIKLMIEFTVPGGIIDGNSEIVEEAALFNYGVRFFGETIAVDLSFLRSMSSEVSDELVMGIPYLTFSARF
jgi:hypothetical protein